MQLLRTFTREEVRDLKKFVRSPFFNQRPEVVALSDWLTKYLRSEQPVPDKTAAFRAVFGDKPYDDHRIRMAISFLYQAALRFLSVRDFLSDQQQQQAQLARSLRRRKLPELARQARQASAAVLHSLSYRNADMQEAEYQLLLEQHRSDIEQNAAPSGSLQELSDQLDRSFLSRKLWQSCFLLSHQTVSNFQYDFGLLDLALTRLDNSSGLETPAISLYYYCFKALNTPGEKAYFQTFRELLYRHSSLFPEDELRDLYVLAVNFCIRQYNAGNKEYLPEQFDFYREGLAKGYFLVEGVLSRYTYQNAATIGLVLREYDWVDAFIHSYCAMLPPSYRESLFSFNLARLEYHRQRPDQALSLLQKAEYKDILLHLAAKMLQLKIYYEMEATDLLESHLQAFQTFIRRKKNLGYHRENYRNTIHFTRKLLECPSFEKKQRAALRTEIESAKAIAEKEWLLEQVEDGR